MPELPGLRTQRVGPDDPRAIAQAGDALATCYRADEPVRFGVSAISYAVAPAILAALTEPGGERMALILGIGGYHDVTAAITYLTTGYYRSAPGATWRRGMPEPLARWVFALAAARQLPEFRDRELLGMIARARLADPDAEIGQLEAGLGDGGRGVMALVGNGDPDRVPALLAALPEPVRGDIETLDLSRYRLDQLSAHLLLIHGRDDPLIPASESQALAAAVPLGHADVFIVGNLSHVAIRPGNIPDLLLLWQAAYPAPGGARRPDCPRHCALRHRYDQRIGMRVSGRAIQRGNVRLSRGGIDGHRTRAPVPADCYPWMKASRSALIVSASVVGMPCGKPL